jgi:hypothetical protein
LTIVAAAGLAKSTIAVIPTESGCRSEGIMQTASWPWIEPPSETALSFRRGGHTFLARQLGSRAKTPLGEFLKEMRKEQKNAASKRSCRGDGANAASGNADHQWSTTTTQCYRLRLPKGGQAER